MTLGRILRDRRIELGKSIEQISAATRIHVRILSAIEDDRYVDLPARTFTRGFITSYCKALRLDAEQLFKDHHEFLEQKFAERKDRDEGHHGYVFEGKELEQNKRGMVIGASIAVCFAVAVLLIFKPQNHKRKEKHKDFVAEDVAPPPTEEDSGEVITTNPTPPKSAIEAIAPGPSPQGTATSTASTIVTSVPATTATASLPSAAPTSTPARATPTLAPATPTPARTTPTPTPSSSPANEEVKKDPLHKGDELGPNEFKKKIAFEALEDVFVKYRADDKPEMQFNLRKGRFLVIKAKTSIVFEVDKPESLQYRTKTRSYSILPTNRITVQEDGSLGTP